MRFGVEHDLVERKQIVGTEEEVEIFECLGLCVVLEAVSLRR
jgi:hypothetical protein